MKVGKQSRSEDPSRFYNTSQLSSTPCPPLSTHTELLPRGALKLAKFLLNNLGVVEVLLYPSSIPIGQLRHGLPQHRR